MKQRLVFFESIKSAGWDEWSERAQKKIQEQPEVFNTPEGKTPHDDGKNIKVHSVGRDFVVTRIRGQIDERVWSGMGN
jgi:hypothetical protein